MDRSKSKYFNTAIRMDEALLELLSKKDLAYITVKEICEKAKVNRSTFYLHYETIDDLLVESAQHIINQFVDYMPNDTIDFIKKLPDCSLDELYLITPEYLTPYLTFIKNNQRIFRVSLENSLTLKMDKAYKDFSRYILSPILDRFHVPPEDQKYIIPFYINGLIAIVKEWLKNSCEDSIEHIVSVMQSCVQKSKIINS